VSIAGPDAATEGGVADLPRRASVLVVAQAVTPVRAIPAIGADVARGAVVSAAARIASTRLTRAHLAATGDALAHGPLASVARRAHGHEEAVAPFAALGPDVDVALAEAKAQVQGIEEPEDAQ